MICGADWTITKPQAVQCLYWSISGACRPKELKARGTKESGRKRNTGCSSRPQHPEENSAWTHAPLYKDVWASRQWWIEFGRRNCRWKNCWDQPLRWLCPHCCRCCPQQLGRQTGGLRKEAWLCWQDWTKKTLNSSCCARCAVSTRRRQNLWGGALARRQC